MLLLVSHDHGNSSQVKIHALFGDYEYGRAMELFDELSNQPLARRPGEDAESPFHNLVELLKVPEGFCSFEGACAFWGTKNDNVRIIASNNR